MEKKEALRPIKGSAVGWHQEGSPKALEISRIAMIPHQSRKLRAILDLSYTINLMEQRIDAVNDTPTKTAPQSATDQMGHVLDRIIYAFTEAEEDDFSFQGKTSVKDGFWRCVAAEGQEWNFAYMLP